MFLLVADSVGAQARSPPFQESETGLVQAQQTGDYKAMYSTPIILPLDWTGRIYVLEDEKGQVVGTGSREVL
jgi:hypothetical protein